MPENGSDSNEVGSAETLGASSDPVTAEFVAGVQQPSSSSNGFATGSAEPPFADNPEVLVGAAFIGGFVFGRLVKRIGG